MALRFSTHPRNRILSLVESDWGKSVVFELKSTSKMEENPEQDPIPKEPSKRTLDNETLTSVIIFNSKESLEGVDSVCNRAAKDWCRLSPFQTALLGTILEDALTQLIIIDSCNTEIAISKVYFDMEDLLNLKYGVPQPAYRDPLEKVDPNNLYKQEYKLNKLVDDRQFCSLTLLRAYAELVLESAFQSLWRSVEDEIARETERLQLIDEEEQNKIAQRELTKTLRHQRVQQKSQHYDMYTTIERLKNEVEDAGLNGEIRTRYVEKWQLARTEQHEQQINNAEAVFTSSIDAFKLRAEQEQRAHSEVELLINICINETLEKVEEWMNKYDKDMEGIDLKAQFMKNDFQNTVDKRINLEATIKKHGELITAWVDFKTEREKKRQFERLMHRSALSVQCWWRGIIVRLQLGPFKVKKQPKAKGKGKK